VKKWFFINCSQVKKSLATPTLFGWVTFCAGLCSIAPIALGETLTSTETSTGNYSEVSAQLTEQTASAASRTITTTVADSNGFFNPLGFESGVKDAEAQVFLDLFKENKAHQPSQKHFDQNQLFSKADQAILETLNNGIVETNVIYQELVTDAKGDALFAFQELKELISQENIRFEYQKLQTEFEVKELVPRDGLKPAMLVFRILHKPSGRTTLFVDKEANLSHPKFRQYVSMLALKHGTDVHSAENGRFLDSIATSGIEENWHKPRELFRNIKRLKKAYQLRKEAYVEFPPGTVSLAILASSAQGTLLIGSGFLEAYAGLSSAPGGLGFSLGVVHRIIKNWQQKKTDSAARKAFKKSVIGIPCKYSFFALMYTVGAEGTGLSGFKMLFSPESISLTGTPGPGSAEGLHLYVISNMMLSALARNAFTDLPLQQQAMGKGKGTVSVKIAGRELAGFTVNDLYFSGIYLIPFTLSKADLLFHDKVEVFGGSFEMGIGRILLLSGALIAAEGIYLMQKHQIHKAKEKYLLTKQLKDKAFLEKLKEIHNHYVNSQKKVVEKFIYNPLKLGLYTAPKATYKGGNSCRLFLQNNVAPRVANGTWLF